MKLQHLIDVMETIAPLHFAESWDNVGLLVGDPAQELTTVLLTIDYTADVAREARDKECEAVISYHPPIFSPLKRITADSLVYQAIRSGIALYSPHTALDVAPGGTNDLLGDVLELRDRRGLRLKTLESDGPTFRPENVDSPSAEDSHNSSVVGLGRIGRLPDKSTTELLEMIKSGLGLKHLLVAGDLKTKRKLAAVGAGACGDLLNDAIASGADFYLTGEMRHHDVLKAVAAGMTVVNTLHSNSERASLDRLVRRLDKELPQLRMIISGEDRDPLEVV